MNANAPSPGDEDIELPQLPIRSINNLQNNHERSGINAYLESRMIFWSPENLEGGSVYSVDTR